MNKLLFALLTLLVASSASAQDRPNVIIILTDDQGYNDVGCYGSRLIKTPRLDRMAEEGTRFTDWYAPASVCSPTRAGLLTGCYPQRVGVGWIAREKPDASPGHVFYGKSAHGLHPDEVTIAELLKARGYATGIVGKWHLGDAPSFLPMRQGFDSYFGVPYSNDMKPYVLMRGEQVIEEPYPQDTLIERYTDEAKKFIHENKDKPFFLYFAHNAPHTPLHAHKNFQGKSARGLYGEVVEEIDWSVGELLDILDRLRLSEKTLVIFTSDNGPWHLRGEQGGSAFPLRGAKGTTYEGGMRVPCIVHWPGKVPAGKTSREMLSHLDLMPTVATLAGAQPPTDRIIDGKDISPILLGEPDAKSPHEAFYYYADGNLNAVRSGKWKYKLETELIEEVHYGRYENPQAKIPPALYDLENDIAEQKNVAIDHPDVVERMKALAAKAMREMGDRRTGVVGADIRPMGQVDNLRVMSFNIRVAHADDGENAWPHRREMLFATIESFMPDLLGLQEVVHPVGRELRERLKLYDLLPADTIRQANPSPIMIRRNRFSVEKTGVFWLSDTPDQANSRGWDADQPRVASWALLRDLERPGESGRLLFVNTHWDHRGAQARFESAKLLKQRVAQLAGGAPVIIAGDFNCADESKPYAAFMSQSDEPRLIDSYRVIKPEQSADDFTFHTFTGKNEKLARLDWILHDAGFRTTACEIVRKHENGRYPSDHFPVTALVQWVR